MTAIGDQSGPDAARADPIESLRRAEDAIRAQDAAEAGEDDADADADASALPRREARTKALEFLFAADVRSVPTMHLVDQAGRVDAFSRQLVEVVTDNRAPIDALIEQRAEGWSLARMPAVDRNVLRLGVAEMLYLDEVPPKVAIDEAVELAKQLSTDSSPRFVNGVLAAIARDHGLV